MRHGAIKMAFVKTKPGEDAMSGYDYSHHHSPDNAYVPGYNEKPHQSTTGGSSSSAPTSSAKRDSLSNMWHLYAKNHSAEPYTEYHKAHNANIFNHVKEHYGVEVAKAMHGHAEALRQGGIYSIRKKYNIMESEQERHPHSGLIKDLKTQHGIDMEPHWRQIPGKQVLHGQSDKYDRPEGDSSRRHQLIALIKKHGFQQANLSMPYTHPKTGATFHFGESHDMGRPIDEHRMQVELRTPHSSIHESIFHVRQLHVKEDLENIENKDKPLSSKALARKLITDFKNKKTRNRKRLRKVSDVYAKEKLQESVVNANGSQKFNELKEHPFVKNSFSTWHNPASYGENHHSFQTKLHTFPANGSTHELRAAVRPNGEHEVILTSHHKNGLDSIHGTGTGGNFHEAITNARANHFKEFSALKAMHPVRAKGLTGMNNQFD